MKTENKAGQVFSIRTAADYCRLFGTIEVVGICLAVVVALGCGGSDPADESGVQVPVVPPSQTAQKEPPLVTVTLPGEPAEVYMASGEREVTSSLSRRLEERFPYLHAVPCLERAAGIYGRTAQADRLPLAFMEFVLHWSGCPDPFAAVVHVYTDDNGEDVFFEELGETLNTISATHAGVARVPAREPYAWRWTVFLTQRDVEMQAVQTTASPGSSLALVVRFLRPVQGASVVTTRPDGRVVDITAGLSGDRMLAAVEIADRPGTQWIEVLAADTSGPHVVLLFPVEVGREPPRAWIGTRRRDETWITDPVMAEAYARTLVDEDRTRFGLPTLTYDDVLAAVARRHSAEMARSGEIAHVSTTTGTVANRLEAAQFYASFAAENIARSSTIADAQEGLMRSPGHRAAVLSTDATRFGIGIVSSHRPETGVVYFITQVFANPAAGPIGQAGSPQGG